MDRLRGVPCSYFHAGIDDIRRLGGVSVRISSNKGGVGRQFMQREGKNRFEVQATVYPYRWITIEGRIEWVRINFQPSIG
ncbi:hypothetical protein TWF788_011409 [Orbilia oligospora]|uniref:Uncharacterized protein n=1 Tax=Orbilia oligospora TaxID=2813651 RepID=A0A6G1MK94_ORBOL|nr:hypothetical protein TWF788_011409 [Orbilia oligospora]KAF3196996.1 hypothetical protein TWF679_003819 [Orbilia oligospora]KAF3223388.1 hypothetical protein TWF191_006401 [Orbilia oligospora]KAF3261001.1 hypothetical protein TWF192_008935 [Orbilia oligospora]